MYFEQDNGLMLGEVIATWIDCAELSSWSVENCFWYWHVSLDTTSVTKLPLECLKLTVATKFPLSIRSIKSSYVNVWLDELAIKFCYPKPSSVAMLLFKKLDYFNNILRDNEHISDRESGE